MSRRLTGDEIAFAMELRSEGAHWKHIATGLGCSVGGLRNALLAAQARGYAAPVAPRITHVRLLHTRKQAMEVVG